ncbi:hypothetical protein B0H21DRAFT_764173 [Amylocystis lapponica]|nr:hypothetical protein B0H21DRAFT_764173 [Amylocystis lapponica]
MPGSNAQAQQIIQTIEATNFESYCALAAAALFTYDYVITLGQELKLVWGRKATGANILFMLNRYLTLAHVWLSAAPLWGCASGPCDSCYAIIEVGIVLGSLINGFWAVFSALRVYAIHSRKWKLPLLVLLLGLVPAATNLYNASQLGVVTTDGECDIQNKTPTTAQNKFAISTRVCVLASDTLVVLTTWRITYGIKRAANAANMKVSLTTLLLRDGTIYFVVLSLLNIADIGLYVTGVYQDMGNFIDPLTAILISHFLSHLHEVYLSGGDSITTSGSSTAHFSDMQFSSRVVGTIGAPLSHRIAAGAADTLWGDDSDELDETYEGMRVRNEPLGDGLGIPD